MNFVVPQKVDRNILDAVESSLTATALDDLLESSLSHLLDSNHVKSAEIQLFNRQKKLIPVASGRQVASTFRRAPRPSIWRARRSSPA